MTKDQFAKAFTNAAWSKHAEMYEKTFGQFSVLWSRDMLELVHSATQKRLTNHREAEMTDKFQFLDVGCGTGALTFPLMDKYLPNGPDIHVTATDLSDGMLGYLNAKLENSVQYQSFANQLTTVQMDGQVLDKIADKSVDVIGSNFGMSIFPERTKGWEAAMRVLKDDGLLVLTVWDEKSTNLQWADVLAELAHKDTSTDEEKLPFVPPSQRAGTDIHRLPNELKAAGFRRIQTYKSTHTMAYSNTREFFDGLLDNPPFVPLIEKLGRQRLEDAVKPFIGLTPSASANNEPKVEDDTPIAFEMTAHVIMAMK